MGSWAFSDRCFVPLKLERFDLSVKGDAAQGWGNCSWDELWELPPAKLLSVGGSEVLARDRFEGAETGKLLYRLSWLLLISNWSSSEKKSSSTNAMSVRSAKLRVTGDIY
jgi:hypothetical protein